MSGGSTVAPDEPPKKKKKKATGKGEDKIRMLDLKDRGDYMRPF